MHIEPGVLNAAKVLAANVAAVGTLGAYARGLVRAPMDIVKALPAAMFFSGFMELWHLPVGASELHFVGASAVYFVFGFRPTLYGFAAGLALQGLFFEPQDLVHLGVNSMSLIVPLIAAHGLLGKRLACGDAKVPITWARIVQFDAIYCSGVVAMVGFWLSLGTEPTPFYNWAAFAAAYLPLVFCEPLFTYAVLRLLKRIDRSSAVRHLTAVASLRVG